MESSTSRSYMASWRQFKSFALGLGKPCIPASEHTVALFATYLYDLGLKPSTIRCKLSAISFHHKIKQLQSPSDTYLIKHLLKGFDKTSPPKKVRLPIQEKLLIRLLDAIPSCIEGKHEAFRLKVLFSTMYHAALRVSETCPSKLTDHALRLSNLVVLKNSILITFVSFKHSAGETVSLKLLKSNVKGCAVSMLKSWLKMKKTSSDLLFDDPTLPTLSRGYVALKLKLVLQRLGLDPGLYSTHSFRIGKTSDLAINGASGEQIRLFGRWKSRAYHTYTKPKFVVAC